MMAAESGEEATRLLSAYQQAAQRDAAAMRRRRRSIRTLIGVIGAIALFVGCIVAVDVLASNGKGDSMTLEVTTSGINDETSEMEAQFGWNSIGYGWCSIKASTWCMFSKDKDKCKQGIECYKNRVYTNGNGAGSGSESFGNITVGDSSWEDDAEVGSPDGTVEKPWGFGGNDGSDKKDERKEEPQIGGED